MADTPTFAIPYPGPGDHTRLWEHFQALAEQVEKMTVGQYEEKIGASVNSLSGTVPEVLITIEVFGRAGIPIRVDASAWVQNIGANNAGARFGVAASGGGLDVPATGPGANYFTQLALGTGISSVYGTFTMTRTVVPTQDDIVTITMQGWLTGLGPQSVNYPRLSVDTRAWPQ